MAKCDSLTIADDPSPSSRVISVYSAIDQLRYDELAVERMFSLLDEYSPRHIPDGELSIAFLDGETMCIMHGKFLNDATPTDVITFPGDVKDHFAGEICISVEYAAEYAAERKGKFSDEMILYLVHGWLHLSGLDDRTMEDSKMMRHWEAETIALLRKHHMEPEFKICENDV
ncbi:MAG: rRNA maturation RNase YbeY [Puniceicoccales bacterium]|jgi:probable rRNA maturation factor|nr:rRNA maturation RNase YbeY [Puniceicoccales bacterium]